jgi:3-hydroxyisobutyrate dehydrogenase-like beta-hydroxyacid dehydrogenase
MSDVSDDLIARADLILSVVPPAEALSLALRLQPELKRADRKPIFIDCNAISPYSVAAVGEIIADTGSRFVDACIIGLPPKQGDKSPALYLSGPNANAAAELKRYGLDVRVLNAPIGAASALKMSYAGITKGLTGLAAAMILAADRAGAGDALRTELGLSQHALLERLQKTLPDMYPKAYRWVAEMNEIAAFLGPDDPAAGMFAAAAGIFARIAQDRETDGELAATLNVALGLDATRSRPGP